MSTLRSLPLALLLVAQAAVAKPLYLTVARSFGTDETAQVDVAFAATGPVELRVLEPNDLPAFLKAQNDLRRAYLQPPTTPNPGRALTTGLNALRQPGQFVFFAIDEEFKKAVAPAMPRRPDAMPYRPSAQLQEVAPKLVGIPPGMTLVRSEWLNLDLGGDERAFNVPGFEAWGGNSGFQERRVLLPKLPAGIYVLQLVQGKVEGQVLLAITDLTVQVKQTDGEVLVRVAGRDQLPKEGAQVRMFGATGKLGEGTTNADGELTLNSAEPRLLLTVGHGADLALVDTDFYSSLAIAPDVFIYSDRPIYRPGDQVRFRGLVRKPDSFLARLFQPKRRNVTVTLSDPNGRKASTSLPIDEFGSFHGTLKVADENPTGVLTLSAELDESPHQAEARVQEYVKPTFYLELTPEKETVNPGEPIRAKVRARRYSGGIPENTAYEVFLYRSALESPSWVDDAGKGGQGSAVTYGSASTTEGKLAVPERLYSSVAERADVQPDDPWASAAKFDENGEAELTIPVPPLKPGEERLPWRYSLTVRARDDQQTFANATTAFFLSKTEVLGNLRMSAKIVKAETAATLAIRSTSLSGRPYGNSEGQVTFKLRRADGTEKTLSERKLQTDADGAARVEVPTPSAGTVIAEVTLTDKGGNPWTGQTTLLVAGEPTEAIARVPALTLESLDGTLSPGDRAELIALLPESWGPQGRNEGPLWLTLSGSGLYRTERLRAGGLTFTQGFEIEKRFGSAVYASLAYPTSSGRWEERTVAFRIIPRERTLSVALEPMRAEATPLGEQTIRLRVTDSTGEGIAAQVSIGVVDKAVYAIQSEFRPRVLDFFYPVGRNNVTSFYSSEFQGYGYGEELARLLRGVKDHAFGAVKPPTRQAKQEERDTAFWSSNLVTDREGRATVTFTLPSNQTLWTVTAVAADASGRFGESTAEFASRGAVSLVASLPQFLRAGDQAEGSVRLTRNTEAAAGKLQVTLGAAGALEAREGKADLDLAVGGEQVVPVSLVARTAGNAEVQVAVAGGKEPLKDRKRFEVLPGSVSERYAVSAYGGGRLELAAPSSAKLTGVQLVLQPSIVDAVLTNVRELLSYPYGCVEQLTSTTVPNVAVYRTLEKVGALAKLDPDSQALLAEARSRSVQGLSRVLQLAVKGGGFTWFMGYSTPSVPMTLIALDGLSYGVEAGLVDRNDPRLVESAAWLEKQEGLPFAADATRAYVLARLWGPKAAPRVRALVTRAEPGDLYPLALAVLAAEKAGLRSEPELKARLEQLVQQTNEGFASFAVFEPNDPERFYWHYPLRRIGMSALLAHAASFGSLDVNAARKKLLTALADPEASTFDRSTAILHSLWLVERDAKAMRKMEPPKVSGEAKFAAYGTGLVATLPPGTRTIEVGGFEGVASLRAMGEVPLADARPSAEGMSLERRYYVLREGTARALEAGQAVAQGEEVYVELSLESRGANARRSAYYVLEDAIPAGFVPLTEDKEFQGAPWSLPLTHEALKRRSLSPERATFFFEEPAPWSDSPRKLGYVLRAQFPGKFVIPPATVNDMYAAGIGARTGSASLTVAESKNARP